METETLWYPISSTKGLTGISGPLRDKVLPELESTYTGWNAWKASQPDSRHMRPKRGRR
jgi:hypothetical protein